jgi:NAD(P)-dependent dehydrogenase (short-subunit alcohol dehydrogenase family)
MCGRCAELNWTKRNQTADLRGRVALVTGARVKIGYHAAIMLLRAGARVIVTTRFPRDAARRYARNPTFRPWSDRLAVYGVDLRHTPSVETFCKEVLAPLRSASTSSLNNACQTVRRPAGFYDHLMRDETDGAVLGTNERALLEGHLRPRRRPRSRRGPRSWTRRGRAS